VSRDDFASTLGVTRNTIQRYEIGERTPTVDFVVNLCDKFNVNTEWLIYGKEPKYRDGEIKQPPAQVDLEVLKDAVDTIEQVLEATGKTMKPEDKAEIIAKIYEYFTDEEQGKDKRKLSNLLKLVANYE